VRSGRDRRPLTEAGLERGGLFWGVHIEHDPTEEQVDRAETEEERCEHGKVKHLIAFVFKLHHAAKLICHVKC
jgi:hypothetical protein